MATAKSLKIRWLPPRAKTSYSKTRIACYHVSAVSPVRQIASKVCQSPVNELLLSSLEANTTYNVILQASVRRNRDNKTLLGPSIEKEFATSECLLFGLKFPFIHKTLLCVIINFLRFSMCFYKLYSYVKCISFQKLAK